MLATAPTPDSDWKTRMKSFHCILELHPRLVVIDASSTATQVGLFAPERAEWRFTERSQEAGEALFDCFNALGLQVRAVDAFAFCEGPGSILGIRTVAALIRTWCAFQAKPVFAYRSLDLLAWSYAEPDTGYIADARRDYWHLVRTDASGRPSPLRRVRLTELPSRLRMPSTFRSWATLPPELVMIPYQLSALLPRVIHAPLLHAQAEPDAFQVEPTDYVRWSPAIHRAPQ